MAAADQQLVVAHLLSPRAGASPLLRRARLHRGRGVLIVAGAHIAIAWLLWLLDTVPLVARGVQPVVLAIVASDPPRQEPPALRPLPPTPQPARPGFAPLQPPTLPAQENPVAVTVPAQIQPQPPTPAAAPAAPVAAPPAHPPDAPPAPTRLQVDHSAVRYLVEPPAEVPRASRRAGESGTVWLRVLVDASGTPVQVLLHRSSGYRRLDEQAVWAMHQARFQPHTDHGRAVAVEVIAPIEYPAE
jgi:periplasmic protein TonB